MGWFWFKFNNLGLALSIVLEFYTSVAKGSELKVRKFLGLIPAFVEVSGGKTGRGWGVTFCPLILNKVKSLNSYPTVVIVTKLNQNPIHGPLTELPTLNSSGLLN